MANFITLAVDGGAGTGKSTLSKLISSENKFMYVETGSLYRAITYLMLEMKISPIDVGSEISGKELEFTSKIIKSKYFLYVGGRDCSLLDLRTAQINKQVSDYAALPAVRSFLIEFQRSQVGVAKLNGFKGIVMEGRDIGTKILPDADLKIFLFADFETRMKRRKKDGELDEIRNRDLKDLQRKVSPLQRAEDALSINTAIHDQSETYNIVNRELLRLK